MSLVLLLLYWHIYVWPIHRSFFFRQNRCLWLLMERAWRMEPSDYRRGRRARKLVCSRINNIRVRIQGEAFLLSFDLSLQFEWARFLVERRWRGVFIVEWIRLLMPSLLQWEFVLISCVLFSNEVVLVQWWVMECWCFVLVCTSVVIFWCYLLFFHLWLC